MNRRQFPRSDVCFVTAGLTPRFSANRTVREYAEKYYIQAAETYQARIASQGAMGAEV